MNLISWILFGLVIGIIANTLDEDKNQIFGWIAVSVTGAVVGGILGTLLFGIPPLGVLNPGALIVAIFLSVLILVSLGITSSEERAEKRKLFKFEKKLHKQAFKKI